MQINKWHRGKPEVQPLRGGRRRNKDAGNVIESHWICVDGPVYALLEAKAERAKTTVDALVERAIDAILTREGM